MKKGILLGAQVAGVFLAAVVLGTCYSPLVNQNGRLNLSIQSSKSALLTGNQAVVLLVDSDYEAALAETLNLIGKSSGPSSPGLTSSDKDRLKTLGQELATNGLVKFGGYPFYQVSLNGTKGSFDIPGLPAGRSYFVKIFVFPTDFTFSPDKIDANFKGLIQSENLVFSTETYASDTGWQAWLTTPLQPGQPVAVNAGQTTSITLAAFGPAP